MRRQAQQPECYQHNMLRAGLRRPHKPCHMAERWVHAMQAIAAATTTGRGSDTLQGLYPGPEESHHNPGTRHHHHKGPKLALLLPLMLPFLSADIDTRSSPASPLFSLIHRKCTEHIASSCANVQLVWYDRIPQSHTASQLGIKCCVAKSLDASPIQHMAAQQPLQGITAVSQEPWPGSQSMMQAYNSK